MGDGSTAGGVVTTPAPLPLHSGVVFAQLRLGSNHVGAITAEGRLFTWGSGQDFQLGHGTSETLRAPREVAFFSGMPVRLVACGDRHTIAVAAGTNELFSWGTGAGGVLGVEKNFTDYFSWVRKTPTLVPGIGGPSGPPIVSVSAGPRHNLAVTADQCLFVWGDSGECRTGTGTDREILQTPTRVVAVGPVLKASAGLAHSAAITFQGELLVWGRGREGQLGLGTRMQMQTLPVRVPSLFNIPIVDVACGDFHTACVALDGSVFTMGKASNGRLGNIAKSIFGKTHSVLPVTVPIFGPGQGRAVAVAVACGSTSTAVVTACRNLFITGRIGEDKGWSFTWVRVLEGIAQSVQLGRDFAGVICIPRTYSVGPDLNAMTSGVSGVYGQPAAAPVPYQVPGPAAATSSSVQAFAGPSTSQPPSTSNLAPSGYYDYQLSQLSQLRHQQPLYAPPAQALPSAPPLQEPQSDTGASPAENEDIDDLKRANAAEWEVRQHQQRLLDEAQASSKAAQVREAMARVGQPPAAPIASQGSPQRSPRETTGVLIDLSASEPELEQKRGQVPEGERTMEEERDEDDEEEEHDIDEEGVGDQPTPSSSSIPAPPATAAPNKKKGKKKDKKKSIVMG